MGAAETGSGKTLAFGIPMVNGLLRFKESASDEKKNADDYMCGLQALVLTPTRELALQVKDHIQEILTFDSSHKYCLQRHTTSRCSRSRRYFAC